ncbi:hypothetical protein N7456_000988 [Penicillium angulare]|uniref:N-acetyltransferase domain-containing protein n=1 Tax=Penicillium angulare TaxID=116970 RepID=A0A9W9GDH6_9EURO|nr:hypothetical protein N7456_000988 [Penicillium angulare]
MSVGASQNTLVLEPASVEDVPAITALWFDAFTQPAIGELFPDTPAMRAWNESWHRGDMETRPYQKYLRVIDTASTDEQGRPRLAAFGKWDLAMPEERGRRFSWWCEDSPYQDCEDLIDGLEQERKRVMGDQKHYYLDTVGTHPDYQRRGAASLIVKWGCDLADRNGVGAYVDASKEGAPLYQKFGFVDYGPPGSGIASMARSKE